MNWPITVLPFLAAVALLAWLLRGDRQVRTTHIRLSVPRLPRPLEGYRIAFLSDLHLGMLYVRPGDLFEALETARPDLVLLGGDYASSRRRHADIAPFIRRLIGGRRTFAVLGNTDHHQQLDTTALDGALQQSGGALLVNERAAVQRDAARVEVIGIDDPLHGDAAVETAGAFSPEADLRVAVVHSPAIWQDLPRLAAHITLCGHTHGGQVRPPGLEAPVTHSHYPRALASGLFRLAGGERPSYMSVVGHWGVLGRNGRALDVTADEGPLLYVSRGIGVGMIPIRFLCPPELVVIEMRRSNGSESGASDG